MLKYVSIRSPLDSSGDLVVQGVIKITVDKTSALYFFFTGSTCVGGDLRSDQWLERGLL